VRIHPANLVIKVKREECKAELREWVDRWNQRFQITQDIYGKYILPGVRVDCGPQRRLLIEVFSYLTAGEIVKIAGEICKSWYAVAWEDEVWKTFVPQSTLKRAQFIVSWYHTCKHCGKTLKTTDIHMLCPVNHRPTCYSCYSIEENRPQHLTTLKEIYDLDPSVFQQIPNVRIFPFEGFECVYYNEANEAIRRERKALANAILIQETPELDDLFGAESFRVIKEASEEDFGIADMPHLLNRFATYQERNRLLEFISKMKPFKQFSRLVASLRRH
jgi:hypothetical protein